MSDKKVRGFFANACMQTAAGGSAGREKFYYVYDGWHKMRLLYFSRLRGSMHHASIGFDQNSTAAAKYSSASWK